VTSIPGVVTSSFVRRTRLPKHFCPLLPKAMVFVSYGFVLVQVRVLLFASETEETKENSGRCYISEQKKLFHLPQPGFNIGSEI
jgi:hypothetical protein